MITLVPTNQLSKRAKRRQRGRLRADKKVNWYDYLVLEMSSPMQKDKAVQLFKSGWWLKTGMAKAAWLQLNQDKLCMSFSKFHESIEFLLARPVWTHEFAYPKNLVDEVLTGKSPSFQEIFDLIPAEKRLIVELPEQD